MSEPRSTPRCDASDRECHLCGDEAVVGRVLDIDERSGMGTVAFADATASVALDLVAVNVGDEVLVHLGFAIERVRPA